MKTQQKPAPAQPRTSTTPAYLPAPARPRLSIGPREPASPKKSSVFTVSRGSSVIAGGTSLPFLPEWTTGFSVNATDSAIEELAVSAPDPRESPCTIRMQFGDGLLSPVPPGSADLRTLRPSLPPARRCSG